MLVICDDLDLPLGKVRLRAQGGHGGHNGLRSILQHRKGDQAFGRIRIGECLAPAAASVACAQSSSNHERILRCHWNVWHHWQ